MKRQYYVSLLKESSSTGINILKNHQKGAHSLLFRIFISLLMIFSDVLTGCAPVKKEESSCGFLQNSFGERLSWNGNLPVQIYIHEAFPSEYIPALKSALDTWDRAAGRKLFELMPGVVTGQNSPAKDDLNVIYYMTTWDTTKTDEQGRTTAYSTGDQIIEADIRINARDFRYYYSSPVGFWAINIEALLVHELGHVLGLKHNDAEPSTMATYLPGNTPRIGLTSADVSSLKCEY